MLIAKCRDLALHMDGGRVVRPGGTLLHDPSGKDWPKNSCLITAFKRSGEYLDGPTDEEVAWAQSPDDVRQGHVFVPVRTMSRWSGVGVVHAIDYKRVG